MQGCEDAAKSYIGAVNKSEKVGRIRCFENGKVVVNDYYINRPRPNQVTEQIVFYDRTDGKRIYLYNMQCIAYQIDKEIEEKE